MEDWSFNRHSDKVLGRGAFGIVYERVLADGRIAAIKRILLPDTMEDHVEVQRELIAIKAFDHSNILKLYYYNEDKDFMYLVLEWCEGTLNDYFNGLHPEWNDDKKYIGPVPTDAEALYQLADGLYYIHEKKFAHRNIKSDNILISSSPVVLKIADFGFTKTASTNGSFSIGNSLHKTNNVTTAPELLSDSIKRATQKCDIFSLGCTFFTFLTRGKHLFHKDGDTNLYFIPINILNGKYWIEGRLNTGQDFFKVLIEGMIKHDPKERTSLETVMKKLNKKRELVRKEIQTLTLKHGDTLLGRGSFGVVYEKVVEGKKVAVKRIDLIPGDFSQIKINRELTMWEFKHPNVLKLFSAVSDDPPTVMYFVLEWCDGSLKDYFNRFKPDWTGKKYEGPVPSDAQALYQLACGLDYIHRKNFVHRDLKSDNILISSSSNSSKVLLKISDFGLCEPTNEHGVFSVAKNSLPYKNEVTPAPELLKNDVKSADKMSDVFSMGCIFFTFLTKGKHLFKEDSDRSAFAIPINIARGKYWLKDRLGPNQMFAEHIIKGMVNQDPEKRTKLNVITQELEAITLGQLISNKVFQTGYEHHVDFLGKGLYAVDFGSNPPSNFKLDKSVLLGRGAYGIVYRGSLDAHEVAVKRLQLDDLQEMDGPSASRHRESNALRTFDHPNVLKLHFVYNDEDFKYLVLERCAATLNQYCQGQYTCQFYDKRKALLQMADGLHYIHSQNFVHRDIKTDNVLIWQEFSNSTEVTLKISDFGFCKPSNEQGSFSLGSGIKGTKTFTAPELLKVEAGSKRRGNVKCDIFSLGCVFYSFLTMGGHPFLLKGGSDYNIPVNIEQGEYNLDDLDRHHQYFAKGLIKGMIKADPLKRIQLEDVKTILLSF